MEVEHPEAGRVGQTLGSYRLVESLGSGGMGQVYLAEDTRLGRRVAVKVLPPETAEQPEKLKRFEREARTIASLSHPGIVTLHSIEEAEGRRFLTMEHVQGQTLGAAIPQDGLPLGRLLSVAIALTDAVSAAHRQGILHRDLKPENVMLTPEGRVKVLDFGLAKLRDEGDEEDRTTRETQSVTQDGRIVGTVAYMSPEQAQGLPVDHRTDVFSLGIILYEMATGQRPFKGRTNLSVLSSVLKDTPRPAGELRQDLPRPLGRMIQRALEKNAEDRYQSTADLRRDLEDLKRDHDTGEHLRTSGSGSRFAFTPERRRGLVRPLLATVGLLVVAVLVGLWATRPPVAPKEARSSIAVFHFQNLSGDPELDWLRTGLTDMLVTNLSQSPALRVLSTSRLHQLLGEVENGDAAVPSAEVVGAVTRAAEVQMALVGSFVQAGAQIRIQAQLQDPESGEVLGSDRVEGDVDQGLFALVDELTGRISRRLEQKARAAEDHRKIEDVTTSSVEAYRYFVKGMHHHERLEELEARGYLEKAVTADPGFAMAHAKLSVVHANLGDMRKAREAASLALKQAERLPPAERHYVEGRYFSLNPATFDEAVASYEAVIDVEPDHSAARNNLAHLLLLSRNYPEALGHLEELRRRGITFPGTFMSLAEAYEASGEVERAEKVLVDYVGEHPERAAGFENLGLFLARQGRYDEALGAYDRAGALDARNFGLDFGHFVVHALQGRWLEAEANAHQLASSTSPRERWQGRSALTILALYQGDLARARALTDEGLRLATTPDQRAKVHLFRAEIAADLDQPHESLAEVERALAEAPQQSRLVAWAHSCRATALARKGDVAEARSSWNELEPWLSSLPAPLAEPHRLQLEGELARGEGNPARARRLLARAAALLPEGAAEHKAPAARIHFELGRAALEAGRPDEARQAFRRVVEGGVERLWQPVPYVRSLALLAQLEEDAGRDSEARRLFALYLDYWGSGQIDPVDVEDARKRLAGLGGRSSPSATRVRGDGPIRPRVRADVPRRTRVVVKRTS